MAANPDFLAISDAAFEAARAVRLANELARLRVVSDLVVNLRTRQTARLGAGANRHRLHGRYRHNRLREKPIELHVPGSMRTQTGNSATRGDFKDSAKRVATMACFIDQRDHLLLDVSISTVQRRVVGYRGDLFPR